MANRRQDVFEALSTLEQAERERDSGGSRYAVKQAAQSALEMIQGAAGNDPLCHEIRERAGRLMEG